MPEQSPSSLKLKRIQEKYGLNDLGDTLVKEWTRPKPHRKSLRTLEQYVNQQILKAHIDDRGVIMAEERIADAADAIANNERGVIEIELQQLGLDAQMMADDFVSYSTVYHYLREVREAEYTPPKRSRDSLLQQASAAKNIHRTRVMSTLETASDQYGHPRVSDLTISASVPCPTCNDRAEVLMFLAEMCCADCATNLGDTE